MDEIFRLRNGAFEQYEELLFERDKVLREAGSIKISYMKEFGDLLLENMRIKVECIRKKKIIANCQVMKNHGQVINLQAITDEIDREMDAYKASLESLMQERDRARRSKTATDEAIERAKKIYHRITKRIHPDIFPETTENEELFDLWQRTAAAYRAIDPDELEDIEALIDIVLSRLGKYVLQAKIQNIEERILRLEREISHIIRSEPYIYDALLNDQIAVNEKKREIKTETTEYQKYYEELADKLKSLVAGEVVRFVWKTN